MYGSLLLEARRSRGLTQVELAEVSGVEQANISAIERGHRVPSVSTFHRLLHACGYELTASAGPRTIPCPPPPGNQVVDDLLAATVGREPAVVTSSTPIATRVQVLNGVLDVAEAIVRAR